MSFDLMNHQRDPRSHHITLCCRAATNHRLERLTLLLRHEHQVGVKLLNRSTRAVSLTDAGQVLLRRSQSVVDLTARIHSELRSRAAA